MKNPTFTLHNGVEIPAVGFGTWQIPDGEEAYRATLDALAAGYRHIDTALAYRNEKSIGKAIKDSKVPREEIFVTTKLPAFTKGYKEAIDACEESLDNLGLDYVDLYLIHAPKPWGSDKDAMEFMDINIETWKAFEVLYDQKKVRTIGVSNFTKQHLEHLIAATTIVPMVNQIVLHPNKILKEDVEFCRENKILVEAYSPLATGRIIEEDRFQKVATKYGKSVAQVLIRWSFQNGFLPLPKSVTKSRIIENLDIFDFELKEEDMKTIGVV